MAQLSVFLLILLLSSCFNKQVTLPVKHLRQVSGVINHLDPHLASGLAANLILAKTNESLYEVDQYSEELKLNPLLASELPVVSEDGLVYTFNLKRGVTYQQNFIDTELVADDFVNAFKRIADPKLISPHYSYFSKQIKGLEEFYELNKNFKTTDYKREISGVKALGPYRLQISLKVPNIDFPYLLTGPNTSPIPMKAIEHYGNDLSANFLGTGPYIVDKYVKNNRIEFKRYQNYHNSSLAKIERITTYITKEAQTSWLKFLAGKVDYLEVQKDNFSEAFDSSLKLTKQLKDKGIRAGVEEGKTNLYYFSFNNQKSPTNNSKLRRAIALGFDYKKFNELFFNRNATVAKSFLPPGIPGNEDSIDCGLTINNKVKARELISSLNIKRPLTILVMNKTRSRQVGEFLKREMKEIGLDINVETKSWSALMKSANEGKFDMFYMAWFTGLPRGLEFLDLIYGGNYPGSFNRAGYQSKSFDELFDSAKRSLKKKKQNEMISKLNKKACEDFPIMPLVHKRNMFVYYEYLKNYIPSDQIGGLEKYYDIVKGK